MNAAHPTYRSSLHDDLAAALDWWRAAGVEHDFTDDATTWLETPAPLDAAQAPVDQADEAAGAIPLQSAPPARLPQPVSERIDFFAGGRPQTLEEFREFWLNAPELEAIAPSTRVPPRGMAGAEIMVLVLDPEASDTQTLLNGPQGRLATRILAATGVSAEQAYFASALPRHMPMADTATLAAMGLGEVVLHHIALAAPKRVMAFGAGLAPLLGEDVTNPDRALREINQSPPHLRLLLSEGLDAMMDMPRLKARFWRRWIEWSAQQ